MYNNLLSIIIVCIFILPGDLNNVMIVLRSDFEIKTEFILLHRSLNIPSMSPLAIKSTFRLCYPKILVQIGKQDLLHDVIKINNTSDRFVNI